MRTALLAIVCSAAASPALAQHVWKVHNGSLPGADFTDLPQAVAAASPHDTILVYQGGPTSGGYYTAATIDKPLTIVGFSVEPQAPSGSEPPSAHFIGAFLVTGIGAGERVVMTNLYLGQTWPPIPTELRVTNCAGEVVIDDFWYSSSGLPYSTLRFENCANVTLRGCEFTLGGSPIEVINSTMLVSTTVVDHTYPYLYPTYYPFLPIFTQTADGMLVTNSSVTIVNSIVRGSQQITGYGTGYLARVGVYIVSGDVTVGPGALVIGGAIPGWGLNTSYVMATPQSGHIYKDSRGVIPNPWSASPPIPTTMHAMLHAWPVAGDVAMYDIWGPPGGFALVGFGDRLTAPLPTPLGNLWVDPLACGAIDLVALTATNGSYSWVRPLPLGAPVGYPFMLQALTLDPTGSIALTVPSPFTVEYPYWITP